MTRQILLLNFLLILVYYWDELLFTARALLRFFIFRQSWDSQKPFFPTDHIVGILIVCATAPLTLFSFLAIGTSVKSYAVLGISLLLTAGIASATAATLRYGRAVLSFGVVVLPILRPLSAVVALPRKLFSRIFISLGLVLFAGGALRAAVGGSWNLDLQTKLDVLVYVFVAAAIAQITAELLKSVFHSLNPGHLTVYLRVVLAIIIWGLIVL